MSTAIARWLDVLIASDPGLSRLRSGLAGAVCVLAAMGAELLVATVMGVQAQDRIVMMLLGSVVAMLGANALARAGVSSSLRAALFFPVAMGLGLLLGILVADQLVLSRVVFLAVMFGAVFVRRFGLDFFFYGFLGWIGYFFALFLHSVVDQLPLLLLAVVVGTVTVLLLCVTVFRVNPRRTLLRIFRSMEARRRVLFRACAGRLGARTTADRERWDRRVFEARTGINETVLMSDGWAAHARALPVGWTADTLRRRLLERQLTIDLIDWSSSVLVGGPLELRIEGARALVLAAQGTREEAMRAARALPGGAAGAEAPHRDAVAALAQGIEEAMTQAPVPEIPETLDDSEEFEPAVELTALGTLPGAPSVSKDVIARGSGWNPMTRLTSTSRQAIQVAIAGGLAILAGTVISGQRYYWAVIAAFVAFTGTGTRLETFGKSLNRVLGTLVGLGAGIAMAAVTSGRPTIALMVIVACVFCGFYLVRVSYAYMIFFITILVSVLYGILGQFSDALLLLRLAETAVGAAIGMLVALLIAPVSTRDAVHKAEADAAESMAEVLEGAARAADRDSGMRRQLDALVLAMDNNVRRLTLVATPLTRYYLSENRPRQVRHRLMMVTSCAGAARAVADRLDGLSAPRHELADACHRVAELAHQLAGADDEQGLAIGSPRAARAVTAEAVEAADGQRVSAVQRPLASLERLLHELIAESHGRVHQ